MTPKDFALTMHDDELKESSTALNTGFPTPRSPSFVPKMALDLRLMKRKPNTNPYCTCAVWSARLKRERLAACRNDMKQRFGPRLDLYTPPPNRPLALGTT
eukprot:4330481-Pleurochrysis_carterae.AAC.3